MSQNKQSPDRNDGFESLKDELRSLPRVSAPWFLEADVLRRLRSGRSKRAWIARPLPAFAASVFGLAVLGGVGYLLYVSLLTGSSPPDSPAERQNAPAVAIPEPKVEGAAQETPQVSPPPEVRTSVSESPTDAAGQPRISHPRSSEPIQPAMRVVATDSASTAGPSPRPQDTALRPRRDSIVSQDSSTVRQTRPAVQVNPTARDTTH